MTGEISAKDLAFAHFIVAESRGIKTKLIRSSTLHFLSKQLSTSLLNKQATYRGAFVAYWIAKQKPFSDLNNQTACLLAVVFSGDSEKNLAILSKELNSPSFSIDRIITVLRS